MGMSMVESFGNLLYRVKPLLDGLSRRVAKKTFQVPSIYSITM